MFFSRLSFPHFLLLLTQRLFFLQKEYNNDEMSGKIKCFSLTRERSHKPKRSFFLRITQIPFFQLSYSARGWRLLHTEQFPLCFFRIDLSKFGNKWSGLEGFYGENFNSTSDVVSTHFQSKLQKTFSALDRRHLELSDCISVNIKGGDKCI